jgi:predicted glycosyltransferase
MRVLFDLLHPAHYHLFKNVIASLRDAGDEVVIIARQKDCLADLLEQSGLPYRLIPRKGSGLIVLAIETIKAAFMAAGLARKKHIDYMVGTSISIGPAARLTHSKSIMFVEDDAKEVPVFAKLGYPIAHYVVTPDCLAFENHGSKHLTYPGYHELAYLHPQRFTPDPNIRDQLGVGPDEKYFLVRLVSLTAHHDIGESGISSDQARVLVEHLSKYGRVFISAEKTVDEQLQQYLLPTAPGQILDVMAFAHLVVGDSQTMTIEAAILGTPSIRCNTFVGRLTVPEEIEHKYGLTVGIKPENFDKLLETAEKWVLQDDIKQQWQTKRQVMLDDCVDVTSWILELFHRLKCN